MKFLNWFDIYIVKHFSYTKIDFIHKSFKGDDKCFFLKINNNTEASIRCIQKWLHVVNKLNRSYVFICDNKLLKKEILLRLRFPDKKRITFVKSKRRLLYKYTSKLTFNVKNWRLMTVAHMMPFYMVNSTINYCWHIDADDTFFILEVDDIRNVIIKVEENMDKGSFDALSLDMWASRHEGKHWTFGVACLRNRINYRPLFEHPDRDWKKIENVPNFDGYFTYLRDVGVHKIGTFYVENSYFVHYGDFLRFPIKWPLSFWTDNTIFFPILNNVFCDYRKGQLSIVDGAIKIDIGLTREKSLCLLNKILRED